MKVTAVGTDQIQAYTAERQAKEAANGTINRELALLRRSFNLGRMATPPKVAEVPFIPMLAENNVRKGFFEHEAFLAVRCELTEEIRPVITFAYYTGCRKGEILMLRWQQVDLAERVVRLEPGETKNDDARTIPLVPDLTRCWPSKGQSAIRITRIARGYFQGLVSRFSTSGATGSRRARLPG